MQIKLCQKAGQPPVCIFFWTPKCLVKSIPIIIISKLENVSLLLLPILAVFIGYWLLLCSQQHLWTNENTKKWEKLECHIFKFWIWWLAKPSLKIRTASAIFWNYLGIFRDYGLFEKDISWNLTKCQLIQVIQTIVISIFFYQLSDWVEVFWGFTKLCFKQMLKISAFYLVKQNSF